MIEAVIAMGFLALVTFAIIQYALIQNAIMTVQYDAREAARYATVHYTDSSFGSSTVQTYLQNKIATSASTVPYSLLHSVTYYGPGVSLDNGTTQTASTLTVEIQYDMTKKYVMKGLIPGLPSTWMYTYYYTTFAEGS